MFFKSIYTNPNIPAFPSISNNPNIIIGYAQQPQEKSSFFKKLINTLFGKSQQQFLDAPNDDLGLNNCQTSYHFDSQCQDSSQQPLICGQNKDGYCRDVNGNIIGLSCAPGLTPYTLGSCTYDPNLELYVQNWQCIPEIIYGGQNETCQTTKSNGIITKNNVPKGAPIYRSMKDCIQNYAACPEGFCRATIHNQTACYRTGNFHALKNECPTNCTTQSTNSKTGYSDCGDYYRGHSHGNCFTSCHNTCVDTLTTPLYGYACIANEDKPYWQLCTNPAGCPRDNDENGNFVFNVSGGGTRDRYCSTTSPLQ